MVPYLSFRCPSPSCDAAVGVELSEPAREAVCPECGSVATLKGGAIEAGQVSRCAVCGGSEHWKKKNFRSEYGCLILVVAAGFMNATYQLSLPAAVLLDFVLYQFLGDVTVCYRCKAEVRRAARNPAHGSYDLHHATHLDKETHRAGGPQAFVEWRPAAPDQGMPP